MENVILDQQTFDEFEKLFYIIVGIKLGDNKRVLVENRLLKRLRELRFSSYEEYLHLVLQNRQEREIFIDLLTTNETYFFREEKHFDFLKELIKKDNFQETFKIWSCASSIGAEVYSLAVIMKEYAPSNNWTIVGSDVSRNVIKRAKKGYYPLGMSQKIPKKYLKKYFLKGVEKESGSFLVKESLQDNITFYKINLNQEISENIGKFNVIFLRNMFIYFSNEKKREIINRLYHFLKDESYLFIGHSETLANIEHSFVKVAHGVYQKGT